MADTQQTVGVDQGHPGLLSVLPTSFLLTAGKLSLEPLGGGYCSKRAGRANDLLPVLLAIQSAWSPSTARSVT